MEKETIVFIVLIVLAVAGGILVVAAERKRMKTLLQDYENIRPGDKYTRVYRSMYGPEDIVTETVVIVGKSKTAKGVPMVTYEYEDDDTPYDTLLEDFLDCFEKSVEK